MLLSDTSIRRRIAMRHIVFRTPAEYPMLDHQFQPCSVDLRLGTVGLLENEDSVELRPGDFRLATTLEEVSVPLDLAADIKGKSSWARLAISPEFAGFVDPGFSGELTLELKNHGDESIILTRGMFIAQLRFMQLDQPVDRGYGHPALKNRYQGQVGPTPSRYRG